MEYHFKVSASFCFEVLCVEEFGDFATSRSFAIIRESGARLPTVLDVRRPRGDVDKVSKTCEFANYVGRRLCKVIYARDPLQAW